MIIKIMLCSKNTRKVKKKCSKNIRKEQKKKANLDEEELLSMCLC